MPDPSYNKIQMLKDRAQMLAAVRLFFMQRDVLEVDCPMLTSAASIDAHIDLIATEEGRYLHTSPEYAMKRLLAYGAGDIYQLCHVFRKGEYGLKHNPEFMMVEWYRKNFSFEEMIAETAELICLVLGKLPLEIITYDKAFEKYLESDVNTISNEQICQILEKYGVIAYESSDSLYAREELLNQLLAIAIEPQLGSNCLTALWGYPPEQAALANTKVVEGKLVAERFEIYYQGVELCNGYHELTNAEEQRQRFLLSNQQRKVLGKESLPLDEYFLEALQAGLPDCCGVAVGFDRLMMLRLKAKSLAEILPFAWNEI